MDIGGIETVVQGEPTISFADVSVTKAFEAVMFGSPTAGYPFGTIDVQNSNQPFGSYQTSTNVTVMQGPDLSNVANTISFNAGLIKNAGIPYDPTVRSQ